MSKDKSHFTPIQVNSDIKQPLEKVLRQGAQKMLQLAVEADVHSFIESYKSLSDDNGVGGINVIRSISY
jgi:hypothetical protein